MADEWKLGFTPCGWRAAVMPGPQIRDKDKIGGGLSCLLLRPPAALRSAKFFENYSTAALITNDPTALPPTNLIFLICFREKMMKQIKKIKLVAGWRRWVSRVRALYLRRVREPVYQWRAHGSPREFLPQLPWWHPFVYRFLVLVGGLSQQRWLRRGQPRPVPQVRRGARVYYLQPELVFSPSPQQQQHLRWQRFLLQQELQRIQRRAQQR